MKVAAMSNSDLAELLFDSTQAMFNSGTPLMHRVVPKDKPAEVFAHYPKGDATNPSTGSRYFYHCHPPGQRIDGEHGHFHIFFERSAMPDGTKPIMDRPPIKLKKGKKRANVVHIAALSVSLEGLPMQWFTTNRWVTDEWVHAAKDIVPMLDRYDMRGSKKGDPLVNDWVTAMVGLAREDIAKILRERDVALRDDPEGKDKSLEMLSALPISLEELLARA
jgi:hypothetical protein